MIRRPLDQYQTRIVIPVFVVMFLLLVLSCKQNNVKNEKPVITVSILPQKFLVEQIAGNKYDVEVLIPPGANPVTYEPLPKQLIQIKKSNIYFQIGYLVFEQSWINKIKTINPDMTVVNLSDKLDLISGDHDHGDGHREHVNPHVWMSPLLMKDMARRVTDVLKKDQPGNSMLFETNNEVFQKRLDTLHTELKATFDTLENKNFLIYHPALTYFAKDYGLNELSLEKEGKEPSPKEFAALIELAKSNNIRKILVQSQFDQSNATVLAKEIGGEVVSINPLSEDWMEEMIKLKNVLTQK